MPKFGSRDSTHSKVIAEKWGSKRLDVHRGCYDLWRATLKAIAVGTMRPEAAGSGKELVLGLGQVRLGSKSVQTRQK